MNEFDQFMKHVLKVRQYARYTDDFVAVAESREYLEGLLPPIRAFLDRELALTLHPKKTIIRSLHQGVDFLGYVVFQHHRLIRTKTKRRMFAKIPRQVAEYKTGRIAKYALMQSVQSYLGVLSHANTHALREEFLNMFWFLLQE